MNVMVGMSLLQLIVCIAIGLLIGIATVVYSSERGRSKDLSKHGNFLKRAPGSPRRK